MTYRTKADWWREAKDQSSYPGHVHISDLMVGDIVVLQNSVGEDSSEELGFNRMAVVCVNDDWVTFWRPTILMSSLGPPQEHVERFAANRFHTRLFYRVIRREGYNTKARCDGRVGG